MLHFFDFKFQHITSLLLQNTNGFFSSSLFYHSAGTVACGHIESSIVFMQVDKMVDKISPAAASWKGAHRFD